MKSKHERSWILFILQLFLGVGAVFGGVGLMIDPTGESVGLASSLLERSPFQDFLIPGIILFIVLGIFPLLLSMALITRWDWSMADKINIFKDRHWSWTFSLYIGFTLIIWIAVQVYMINAVSLIHMVYIALGLVIQIVTLLPSIQARYKTKLNI